MSSMRRAARELALKTTFQVDVGKQPLSDVLDGFLEELRENATGRILKVASTTGNSLLEGAAPSDETVSTQSKRQLKGIARALSGELDTLAQSAAALVRDAVSEFGHFSLERALAAFDAESRATVQRLKSQASRPTLYTEHAKHLLETAKGALPLIRQHLELQLPFAINAGQYGVGLVRGIIEKRDEIDKRVSTLASGWALERLAAVDRNILRLAAYELLYMNEPVGAVINEAVELAKKFSTDESGRFVNGILGSLAAEGGSSRVEAKPSPDQAGILSQQ